MWDIDTQWDHKKKTMSQNANARRLSGDIR